MGRVTRRKALKLLASLGAVSLLPATRLAMANDLPPGLARFGERLEARAAERLGRDFLTLRPGEADADRLLETLAGSNPPTHEHLAAAVRSDFSAGRVVELRDWQISLTEARIFALLALTP